MNIEYVKDFDGWNEKQKVIDKLAANSFFHEREVWWCSLGVNIGSEQDGKNESFERPVIVLRKINKDLLLIAPLTTSLHKNESNHRVTFKRTGLESQIIISQIRVISSKRLIRRICLISNRIYWQLLIFLIRWMLTSNINE